LQPNEEKLGFNSLTIVVKQTDVSNDNTYRSKIADNHHYSNVFDEGNRTIPAQIETD
jgi:hypothetical protein